MTNPKVLLFSYRSKISEERAGTRKGFNVHPPANVCMSFSNPEPSKASVIKNSKPNHLYSHDFEQNGTKKGKYFSVVHHDKEGATLQVSAWIQLKIVYIY